MFQGFQRKPAWGLRGYNIPKLGGGARPPVSSAWDILEPPCKEMEKDETV